MEEKEVNNQEQVKEEQEQTQEVQQDAQIEPQINNEEEKETEKPQSEELREDEIVDDLMDEIEKEAQVEEMPQDIKTNEDSDKNAEIADDDENLPLKKYIFYVSKDFTDIIDSLSIDKRTAYINEAIQMKIDSTKTDFHNEKIRRIIMQAIVVFLTVCIVTPLAVLIMNKAIMLTFDNYKYSQQNFEKLYKQRFESDRAYMRSVQYNKIYQELSKKK